MRRIARFGSFCATAGMRRAALGVVASAAVLACGGSYAEEEAPAAPAPYRLASGDRLQLFVWREPELTRELLVRIDGVVTVPLIGDVKAAGLTPSELATNVQQQLAQFVTTPNVAVGLIAANSAQIYVVGRVSKPGAYPLDKPTTFLQALALAGGCVDFAKTDRILVFRGQGSGSKVLTVNYKKLENGTDATENAQLAAGDTILVP